MCNKDRISVWQSVVVDAKCHACCESTNFSSLSCGNLCQESILDEDGTSNFDVVIRTGESKEIAEFVLGEATVVLDDPSQHLFSH